MQPVGRTITVNAGGDLQAALNQALPGDTIVLAAGQTFTAPDAGFVLPAKSNPEGKWIVIRTSNLAGLPAEGQRVTLSHAAAMPKLVTADLQPTLITAAGANFWRLIGIEVSLAPNAVADAPGGYTVTNLIKLGDEYQRDVNRLATDITIDRCYIHGLPKKNVRRGIALNSRRTAVIDSFISDIHEAGADSQAICGWNGPGPFKIVNNYLEGAGETFLLGGADPAVTNLIPSDIEFRRNHLFKPLSWRKGDPSFAGIEWTAKFLFELKNSQRVLVDGNTMENNWAQAGDGFAVNIKSVNQDNTAPWSITQDVTFTNNVIRHSGAGLKLQGVDAYQPGGKTKRILIRNNLWEDIDGNKYGGTDGRFFQINDTPDVIVDHNTAIHTGTVITAYGAPSANFIYTNNISAHNMYGVKGESTSTGTATINTFLPGAIFSKNILAGGTSSIYPAGNYFPGTLDQVGFVNRTSGDYRLATTSSYRLTGTDGQDLGYIPGGASSVSTPSPSPTPALAISNVAASSVTASNATIIWTTNQFADNQVEYGTTTNYGQQTSLNPTMLTNHIEVVSGLAANTLYNYRVKSRTSNGTLAVSANFTFQTPAAAPSPTPTPTPTPSPTPTKDTIPPVISAVAAVSITSTSAVVNWVTNEASDSQVEFGTTTSYGSATSLDLRFLTSHSMALSGLKAGTRYYYRVKSRDSAGNLAVSGSFSFLTPAGTIASAALVNWTNLNGLSFTGGVLKKTGGCSTCWSTATSQQTIYSGDGYIETTATSSSPYTWWGLMQSGKSVTGDNLVYSLIFEGDAVVVFERNVFRTEVLYRIGDVFRIAIEGGVVKYYRNGVVFYTSGMKPVYPLSVGARISRWGATITNAMIYAGPTKSSETLTLNQ